MHIVLIKGRKRVGKNTVADYIVEKLPNKAILIPNAKAVKEEAYDMFNWNGEKDEKGRQLLVDITNTGYNYDNYFWEKRTLETIIEAKRQNAELEVVVIPDWRYSQTKEFFSNVQSDFLGEIVVHTVTVNKLMKPEELFNCSSEVFRSETQLDGEETDFEINNNSTILDLQLQVDEKLIGYLNSLINE